MLKSWAFPVFTAILLALAASGAQSSPVASTQIGSELLAALADVREMMERHEQVSPMGYSNREFLNQQQALMRRVRATIEAATYEGALLQDLVKEEYRSALNRALEDIKATTRNPMTSDLILNEMGVWDLTSVYPDHIPRKRYTYSPHRNSTDVQKMRSAYGVREGKHYLTASDSIPEQALFHGTPNDGNVRGILLEGPKMTLGNIGDGIYTVDRPNYDTALSYTIAGAKSRMISHGSKSDEKRVVRLSISPDAALVDISEGPGRELFEAWKKRPPGKRKASSPRSSD